MSRGQNTKGQTQEVILTPTAPISFINRLGAPGGALTPHAAKTHKEATTPWHSADQESRWGRLLIFLHGAKSPRRCPPFPEQRAPESSCVPGRPRWEPSSLTGPSGSRAGRGHLIVEPACWQEALPRPAGSQHDNETVSMEMSL